MLHPRTFYTELDQKDPLSHFRSKFHLPKKNGKTLKYFCGNSLGLQPKSTIDFVNSEINDWANLGVEGHFKDKNPWYDYHKSLNKSLCDLLGGMTNEIVAMNALTVNLHLLLVSFYNPTKQRFKILIEKPAFSSDYYAISSQIRFHGIDPKDAIIEISPKEGSYVIENKDIIDIIKSHKDDLALVLLSGVNFYNGQFFDLKSITEASHSIGAYAGFDLAHAIGNVPLKLHEWNVDFATWCSYKYLNGGPGGVSGIFIHSNNTKDNNLKRFEGWWGNDEVDRFKMNQDFNPQQGALAWQLSNPNIISMAVLRSSLELFLDAGMDNLRIKSKLMTTLLIEGINAQGLSNIKIITPILEDERGCQVSILVSNNGKNLYNYLIKNDCIVDWREPNVIRVAPVPLYNTFMEIGEFLTILASYNSPS